MGGVKAEAVCGLKGKLKREFVPRAPRLPL